MAIPPSIKEHLEAHDVAYRHLPHPQEFTSPQSAESVDLSGKAYAKTVVVVVDGELTLAAVPANERVDVEKLAQIAGASSVRLAEESEFRDAFPQCEVGAMPPLGNLFGMPVWLDASFERRPTIAFDAGTHTDTVEVSVEDFKRLVGPTVARLTEVDESEPPGAAGSVGSVQRATGLTGVAPLLDAWTATESTRPVTLELTREDGEVIRERELRLISARIDSRGPDAPALQIALGEPVAGGRRVSHRLPRLKAVSVELGEGDQAQEIVFESAGRGRAVIRVGSSRVAGATGHAKTHPG